MAAYASKTRAPEVLTKVEQRELLRITGLQEDTYRDHVIYALALGTALRAHEIAGLDVCDVFTAAGRTKRFVELRVFKGAGRESSGRRPVQQVILSEDLRAILTQYRKWKKKRGEAIEQDSPLFLSRFKKRISTRQLRHSFGVWQERAGFERKHNFHSLRHTACSSVQRAAGDLRLTQMFARHAKLETTVIYTHPTSDDLMGAVANLLR